MTILFLDFDGVLHPNEAYFYRGKRGVELRADGHSLFEYAALLEDALKTHPDVRVVLSTSWVWALSFNQAKARLPDELQKRVNGSTWHSSRDRYAWQTLTRYQQISQYVFRHNLTDWLALDDDDEGWPAHKRHHLVHTDEWGGLGGTVGALDELACKLELRKVD